MVNSKVVLVTGCAGFIGFHVTLRLLKEGWRVVGLDQMNSYYDPGLKWDRLSLLRPFPSFTFIKGSIENQELLESLFQQYSFDVVVNLAAQAGVRYSLTNPEAYVQANLVGFANILECSHKYHVSHFLYASSSSVYGNLKATPFSEEDKVDEPVSLYAATKKANELMAYTYSHLYQLPTTGLRFFTVYGPWGRPDMALFSFSEAILHGKPIKVFNYGNMKRDFTYIDDCVDAIMSLMEKGPEKQNRVPYKIYNIGSHRPVALNEFIQMLEKNLGMTAKKEYLPLQPGDVLETYANINALIKDTGYEPGTTIEEGIKRFVEWYKDYYKIK